MAQVLKYAALTDTANAASRNGRATTISTIGRSKSFASSSNAEPAGLLPSACFQIHKGPHKAGFQDGIVFNIVYGSDGATERAFAGPTVAPSQSLLIESDNGTADRIRDSP